MDLLKAIYTRRAVRNYKDTTVTSEVLMPLIHAAIQAPSAVNQQPWSFAIYQGRHKLHDFSEEAKAVVLSQPGAESEGLKEMLGDPHFDLFYNANTLVVILAKADGLNPAEDCCLAAQNFMLAAHAQGLGTCPIGFARPWLNLPETKVRLGIPPHLNAVFPLIVGFPDEVTEPTTRNDPEIVAWEVSQLEKLHPPSVLL